MVSHVNMKINKSCKCVLQVLQEHLVDYQQDRGDDPSVVISLHTQILE